MAISVIHRSGDSHQVALSLFGILTLMVFVFLSKTVVAQDSLVAIGYAGDVYTVSLSGDVQLIGSSGFVDLNSLARSSTGQIITSGSRRQFEPTDDLIAIDPQTGVGTIIASLSINDIRGLAFSPDDTLFALVDGGFSVPFPSPDRLYQLIIASGSAQFIGELNSGAVQALAFSPDGRLYGWDIFEGLLEIDPATGSSSLIEPICPDLTGLGIQGIDITDAGLVYGGRVQLLALDVIDTCPRLVARLGNLDLRGFAYIELPQEVGVEVRTGTQRNGIGRLIIVSVKSTQISNGDTSDFDALEVDPVSVLFGPSLEPALPLSSSTDDVDNDGDLDLQLRFALRNTGIDCNTTSTMLTGETFAGQDIFAIATDVPVLCPAAATQSSNSGISSISPLALALLVWFRRCVRSKQWS